jgi:tRNA (cytidine/uridine-2'-O-)-methyltransferase
MVLTKVSGWEGDMDERRRAMAERLPAIRLALYQPDRPHNFGGVLRLCACFGVALDVVEPCGFPLDDRRIRRAALDYGGHSQWVRHMDFTAFETQRLAVGRRLVLLSTAGEHFYHRAMFEPDDILMLGSESTGVPEAVHRSAGLRVRIPLQPGLRSLNVVTAAAIGLAEALRQTGMFPEDGP